MTGLYRYCIHTFRHSGVLSAQLAAGGGHVLTEHRSWVTGLRLQAAAQRLAERMPLLFSAAETEEQSGVIYWAVIDQVSVDAGIRQTRCSYSELRPVVPPRPLPALRLRNGGRPVSADLIRPYAICYTPDFLA